MIMQRTKNSQDNIEKERKKMLRIKTNFKTSFRVIVIKIIWYCIKIDKYSNEK